MDREYTITGHMVVKNEARWIWYSVMSVIDYLDKLIIFDTGSKDGTVRIIQSIIQDKKYKKKVVFRKIKNVNKDNFNLVRQKQIEMTDTDYFMIVDGDEIWWKESLDEVDYIISTQTPEIVAARYICPCEDIFHYRYDEREGYKHGEESGCITIRVFSMKIPGICCAGYYGIEGYYDSEMNHIDEKTYQLSYVKRPYFHTSYLPRAGTFFVEFFTSRRRPKMRAKADAGFPPDYKYPEVFYLDAPQGVISPFHNKDQSGRKVWKAFTNSLKKAFCFLKSKRSFQKR